MNIIYDVLLKKHWKDEYICIFYDEDRDKALKEMERYVKAHGFTTPDGQFSVEDVVLRERESTGKILSDKSYCELFDTVTGKRKKVSYKILTGIMREMREEVE